MAFGGPPEEPRSRKTPMSGDEFVAMRFHQVYERLAPEHGYETREESRVAWPDVPEQNRKLMIAVVGELRDEGTIE